MCDILADNTVMPVIFSDNNASYEISKQNNLMKNILKMNVSLFLLLCALPAIPSDKDMAKNKNL